MLYFIPAWYADGMWTEQEQYWYARRMHTEFDDTVKHIQLFQRTNICPFKITLLSFAPNFRHFLHRQGIYHAPYWSCFDAIQSVERKKTALLSYHNLKWPDGIEFVYSMFCILAMLNGKKYAKIEFSEYGNLIEIDMYKDDKIIRKNIYDDRGFVSSSIVYKDGSPYYQDYLSENGIWKIRCYLNTSNVIVNPKQPTFRIEYQNKTQNIPFQKEIYDNIEQVIEEVLNAYLELATQKQDIFCAAIHNLHINLIKHSLNDRNLILSIFQERNHIGDDITPDVLNLADHLICDSSEGKQILINYTNGELPECTVITPFDTRPDFGISQQMTTQKILVPVDGIDEYVFKSLIAKLGEYLCHNKNAEICLFTRKSDYNLDNQLLQKAKEHLKSLGKDIYNYASLRCFSYQCVDELSVSRCLREQRLIVDFRKTRDVYLRVIAISMGIPQIIMYPSEFVVSGENGILLKEKQSLNDVISYYLDELSNWNKALIASYEIGKKFNTQNQIKNWKGVIDSFERN